MPENTRWKCPETGRMIDFEPTKANFAKYAKVSKYFLLASLDQKFEDGNSPWAPSEAMIQYDQE